MSQQRWIELALVVVTTAVYAAVFGHEFINLDDDQYVSANPMVGAGLSLEGIVWAFAEFTSFNWHPITWLSHMLDVSLFGMNPGAHHGVNLLFHVLNGVLLFRLLCEMTGERWPSAVVAAWFALHPAHVESVAWVAERKDVLSTFFLLLSLRAYVGWARAGQVKEAVGKRGPAGKARAKARNKKRGEEKVSAAPAKLTGVALWLALGLMSKPMLVTAPFVMLLLDIWPLRRFDVSGDVRASLLRCIREKWLLFLLAFLSSVVTWIAQSSGGAMAAGRVLGIGDRLANAVVSCGRYLGKAVAPVDLAIYYPHPGGWPGWAVGLAGLIAVALTAAALLQVRLRPWWTVGWLWFLGTLVPVIGIVQVGSQAMADRYTYVPYVGLFIAVAFGAFEASKAQTSRLRVAGGVAVGSLVLFAFMTWQYVPSWRNSISVFTHSLHSADPAYPSVLGEGPPPDRTETPLHNGLYTPYYNLGTAYAAEGNWSLARRHFEAAIVANATFPEVFINLGVALAQQGDLAGSKRAYEQALQIAPDNALALRNLGLLRQMMR